MKSMRLLRNVANRTFLVRIDSNVQIKGGRVKGESVMRLESVLPTIEWLQSRGAKVVLVGHRGRPDGVFDSDLSIAPVARYFSRELGCKVQLMRDFSEKTVANISKLKKGEVVMLENIRFHPEEERNGKQLSRWLSGIADVYINDAFGVCHRTHASVVGVAKLLPSYAGLRLMEEIRVLREILRVPTHPLVMVMGGVKVNTKMPVIDSMLAVSESVLLGGVLANKLYGFSLGRPVDVDGVSPVTIKKILRKSHVHLPYDVVVLNKRTKKVREVDLTLTTELPATYSIMDIGPRTAALYADMILMAKMVVWNGPMGLFEDPRFVGGTDAIVDAVARTKAKVVLGGGETLQAVKSAGCEDKVYWTSTGGGAMLAYLAGKRLPALDVLS